MHTLRTRFKQEIVAEFLPPTRKLKQQRVIILLSGMPSVPSKKHLMEFLSKKGFWVFFPRYRGTWESEGKLFKKSPHLDVIDVIDALNSGFVDLWNNTRYKLKPDQIILLGSSFGGAAGLLASTDQRVDKAFLFSPVIDWQKSGKGEPIDSLTKFTEHAFGNSYRIDKSGWKKIKSGKFYNPVNAISQLTGSKIFLVHARDDLITPYQNTKDFAEQTQSQLLTLPRGGHLSSKLLLTPRIYNHFKKFVNRK